MDAALAADAARTATNGIEGLSLEDVDMAGVGADTDGDDDDSMVQLATKRVVGAGAQ